MRKALAIAILALVCSCAPPHQQPAATPAVGDSCLVGTWTEVQMSNVNSYGVNGESFPVSGFKGTALTIKTDGSETWSFQKSAPLEGNTAAGDHLVITVRGTVIFHIKGDGHRFTETGGHTDLPTSATLDGRPVRYSSYWLPGSGTYTCSSHSLEKMISGVQTDTYSR